ncbi:MAG: NusG domain II-containing protein [Bacilli bacterium]|jgi:hypothetical protein|nr:NusG domain II-containing protein [Bacilli bacterium]
MKLKLNKLDILLTIIISILGIILIFLSFKYTHISGDKVAEVYYKNKLVYTFDLSSKGNDSFEIQAANGPVKIIKEDDHVRVVEENSKRHLCSLQGWSDETLAPIVCLPNELYIKIEGVDKNDDVDVFIK